MSGELEGQISEMHLIGEHDRINGIVFTPEELLLLAVAEGFAEEEFRRISHKLGEWGLRVDQAAQELPANYVKVFADEARWSLG